MDRDHARGFVKQVLEKEEAFLADLKNFQEQMETVDDWDNISRDFAPKVKAFYNAQLEQWQRYYLGLDSANMKFGFSVMHTAQKKDRAAAAATIPHSVFGELKQRIKVGQTTTKLSATGGHAAREIIEKKLGQGGLVEIETRGKGGKLGGGLDDAYDREVDINPKDHIATPAAPPITVGVPPPPPPKGMVMKTEPVVEKRPPPPKKKPPPQVAPSSPTQEPSTPKKTDGEQEADPNLLSILERRKNLYGSGKY